MTFLYSYYNKKAGAFMDPWPSMVPPDGQGKSVARTCKLQEKQARAAHLDECDFYVVGEFDDETGKLVSYEQPKFIIALSPLFPEIKESNEVNKDVAE